jgi:hypothetical protein
MGFQDIVHKTAKTTPADLLLQRIREIICGLLSGGVAAEEA